MRYGTVFSARQFDGECRCLRLIQPGAARDAFDGVAAVVARTEVHARVDAGRVAAQDLLDRGNLFHQVAPGNALESAQRGNGAARRRRSDRFQKHQLQHGAKRP